jgi:DNA-binding protein HU-beta
MTMNELLAHVAAATGMNQEGVKKIVEATILAIVEKAGEGETVAVAGFGQFKVKDAPARQGRNPATGATIEIAATRKMTFAPAKAVKDKLNT